MSLEDAILNQSQKEASATDLLRAARKYRNDKLTHGLERVNLYVEDVEGPWLENWSDSGEIDFSAADLSKDSISNVLLNDLSDAKLLSVSSRGVNLNGAKLIRVIFKSPDLNDVKLTMTILSGVDLREADLSEVIINGADLRETDLSGINLRGAYLRGANLSGTILNSADLSGAYLNGAILNGANLSGADLSGAYLSGADLREADFSDAILSGTKLDEAQFGFNPGVDEDMKIDLKKRGAKFVDSPGDRSLAIPGSPT